MLTTPARYRVITGDTATASATVETALVDAQRLLEDELGRELETAVRTEQLAPAADGSVYPTVTPVTSLPTGVTVANDVVYGATPGGFPDDWTAAGGFVDLVYTGGFDPGQTDRTARDYLPRCIERDVCFAAYWLIRPGVALSAPAGATAVRLGDAAVTYATGTVTSKAGVQWSPETLRWRRR